MKAQEFLNKIGDTGRLSKNKKKQIPQLIENPYKSRTKTNQDSVPQSIGKRATETEEQIANDNWTVYMVTFEMKIGSKRRTNMALCQELFDNMLTVDRDLQLLPWYNQGNDSKPAAINSKLYDATRGRVRLSEYTGYLKRYRGGHLQGRFRIQSRISFTTLKDKLNKWLHNNDHYIRQDYIEAQRVSRIGFY